MPYVKSCLSKLWDSTNSLSSLSHWQISKPYSKQGGRLCPSHYCQPPRIQKAIYTSFKLALMGRNMQVRFYLKIVLESWDWIFLGIKTSFLWNAYFARSIGPDVNHPRFHLVFAQFLSDFCLIFFWFWANKNDKLFRKRADLIMRTWCFVFAVFL